MAVALLYVAPGNHFAYYGPFLGAFILGSLFFWQYWSTSTSLGQHFKIFQGFILVQMACLLAAGFIWQSLGFFYLSLIPVGLSLFYLYEHHPLTEKGPILIMLFVALLLVCLLFNRHWPLSLNESVIWGAFVCWSGSIYWMVMDQRPRYQDQEERRRRLFFHDLINHTHGLLLFLNHKLQEGQHIKNPEISTLSAEIRLMQSLIQDHFALKHKNLKRHDDYGPLSAAKGAIDHLLNTYLNPRMVEVNVAYNGQGLGDLHYPSLFRILSNLIKNAAEVGSDQLYLIFESSVHGLKLTVKNRTVGLWNNPEQLSHRLEGIILQDDVMGDESGELSVEERGLGLESVQELAAEQGGSFEFRVEGDYWIGIADLPYRAALEIRKAG